MSGRRGSAGLSNNEMEAVSKFVYDDLLDEVMLGLAFDVHRSVRTGLFSVLESAESPSKVARLEGETSTATKPGTNIPLTDVFGQTISTMVGVPALKKQPECVCPNCQRNLAASRFAPHLEKCMGMGRNSSRLASRRLATSGKETSYRETGMDEDEDDEDWIEPKVSNNSKRRHRDKNSPRRTKGSSATRVGMFSNASSVGSTTAAGSSKGDIYLIATPDGTITPPSSYDVLSVDERQNLFNSMCGVISTTSKKICTRSTRCPIHTEAQRREVRKVWLQNDDETHVDIDSFTEGDTLALRESLGQYSGASSPADSTVSTSSNPSANSSVRGGGSRSRDSRKRGNRKGRPGSKSGSRGSTPPLLAD